MTDNELDTRIDEVASAMTSAPHDTRLAHRVAMRIAGLDAGRARAGWLRPWILVPAASVAVLLVAVLVVKNAARDNSIRLKPDAAKTATSAQAIPNTVSSSRQTSDPDQPPERVALRKTAPLARRTLEGTLEPLTVEAIAVEHLEVAPMALSAIDINPIAIDRIEIPAMP